MWSDWIRSLRDKELLYKKGLLLVDQLEATAKDAFEAAWKKVIQVRTALFWILVVALATTLVAGAFWLFFRLIGVEAAWCYQVLIIPVGLVWALFLVCIAILLGTFEGVIKQFPRLEKPLADVKQSILRWLRLPAWVGFLALFLAVLVGRFPDLSKPESILSLLGIIAAFGLASFLGLCSVNVRWLKRLVQIQLLIALVLLLLAPQFPNVTAWLEKRSSEGSITIGLKANPKRVTIDLDSPPEFFVVGKPRFWFSLRSEGEFVLWDTKGFDPDTNEKLKPIETKEKRDEILASLRAESAKKKRQQEVEMARKKVEAQELLEKEQAAAARRAAEQAVAQHASDLTRYLGTREARKAGDKQALAVVAVSENGKLNSNVGQVIAGVLKTESVEVTTSRFTPEFVSDGLFAQAFADSRPILSKLELTNSLGVLLLARQTVQYSTNASLQNIITANMRLEVLAVAVADSGAGRTLAITASGVGFKPEDARSQAEERLSKKIQDEADSLRNATRPNNQ